VGFLEEAVAAKGTLGAPPRWVALREDLGEDDWLEFVMACGDKKIPATAIHAALRNRGVSISDSTIKSWARDVRNGEPPWDRKQ
jgi:hypothetical protein